MGCASCSFKTIVIALALLQFAIGVVFMAAGIYVFVSFGNIAEFQSTTYTLIPASIIIAAGVILLLLGVFGICGSCMDNKCMLFMFFIFSLGLFLLEMTGAIVALAMKSDLESAVQDDFENSIKEYNTSSTSRDEVDWIQTTFQCCGNINSSDWQTLANMTANEVPSSCCSFNSTITNCTKAIVVNNNIQGCGEKLHDVFFNNLNIIAGVGIAFAFVQLIALSPVCYLLAKKRSYEAF